MYHTELSDLILKEYARILETGELFDTEILVGEEPNTKTFRLHSFILKTQSPYFRTALSNDWSKVENNIIKFQKPNFSVEVFEILVNYIYSGKIKLNNDVKTNIALFAAADELCLIELCYYIEGYLLKDEELLKRNFVLIHNVVNKFTHYTKLSQFFQITYQRDLSLMFKADDFITIKRDDLLELFINNNDCLPQIEIWDKLMEWAIANSDELSYNIEEWTNNDITAFKAFVQPFISHVNFKEITYSDFLQKIQPYKNIFDDKLYIEIIEYYCFKNNHIRTDLKLVDYIDSRIIDLKDATLIANWINIVKQEGEITFNLLIRGSRDGFGRGIFHMCCDNMGPTVTIVRVKNSNEILGGYNPCNWESREADINCDYNYDSTKESFVFFLDKNNLENSIFSKVVDVNHAIYNNINHGPCFGGGDSDFELFNKKKHGQCIRVSYDKAIRRSEEYFEIDEYEVFQIVKKPL